jgi:hypothetical protein
MDKTTKQRYISTSIWSDEWFDSLSTLEKLIYFHLLTNEFTNAAGVYHFSLKQIRVDLDISREEVQAAIEKFEAAGKAYYYHEYIIIPKWLKHQKISERNKIFMGVLAILKSLPEDIKRFIADRKHYDFPVEKHVAIPPNDGPCPKNDGPCPIEDGPSKKEQQNGMGHAEKAENSAYDSDLDSDSDSDSDDEESTRDSGRNNSSSSSSAFASQNKKAEDPPKSEPHPPDRQPQQTSPPGFVLGEASAVWEKIRGAWNGHNCPFTCDKLFLNLSYDQRDRVRGSMATYTADQMVRAIDRYFEEREKKPEGYEYRSFYLFVEKGMEFYVEA